MFIDNLHLTINYYYYYYYYRGEETAVRHLGGYGERCEPDVQYRHAEPNTGHTDCV